MQRVVRTFVIVAVALFGILGSVRSAAAQQADLSAADGVVSLPAAGETTAVVTAVFRNTTAYIAYLTSASTDVASGVELRDGSKGEPAAVKFISVPAYGSLTLDPKGLHLALTGLTRALKAGESIKLSVTTDQGATVSFVAVVK